MTTITPTQINPPKQEGWSWSVKSNDGNYYGVKADLVPQFAIGKPIEVEVTVKEKSGKTYRDVSKVLSSAATAPAQAGAIAPQYQKQPTPLVDAERMFVAGALNALLPEVYRIEHAEGRSLGSDKIRAIVQILRVVFSDTFGKNPEPLK